jgi:hypothetical protein
MSAVHRRNFFRKRYFTDTHPMDVVWHRLCRLAAGIANGAGTLSRRDRLDALALLDAFAPSL